MTENHTTDNEVIEEYLPPADRFLLAQAWWIASELVRRHPHLRIGTVLTPEKYRLLLVYDEPDAFRVQFDLVGGAKYLVAGEVRAITWIEMMASGNAHEAVKRIERETGLGVPQNTLPSTPKALAYRVIASALAAAVNDRHDWYAEEAPFDFETDFGEHPTFAPFESVADAAGKYLLPMLERQMQGDRPEVFHQPFMVLMRDHVPVAVFDIAGVAHTLVGAKELMPMYRGIHDNLTLTMAQVVGPWLP